MIGEKVEVVIAILSGVRREIAKKITRHRSCLLPIGFAVQAAT